MFDISALKEMKLSELQEIAKLATTIKVNGVKKEALIQHILDHQNATQNSDSDKKEQPKTSEDKPKRVRIVPEKKASNQKKSSETLFSNVEESTPSSVPIIEETPIETKNSSEKPAKPKAVKFKKSDYEKKIATQLEKAPAPSESVEKNEIKEILLNIKPKN